MYVPASKRIDSIAKRLGQLMKPHGFKRRGRKYNRVLRSGEAIDAAQCFNLQGSQGNFGATGRFCVNLGVWFPPLSRALKQMKRWDAGDDPEKLSPHQCNFNLRIDDLVPKKREEWWPKELVPQRDSWFEVGPEHDLEGLTESLARVFESYVIPWFAERGSIEAVALGLTPTNDEQRVIALKLMGNGQEANALFASQKNQAAEEVSDIRPSNASPGPRSDASSAPGAPGQSPRSRLRS